MSFIAFALDHGVEIRDLYPSDRIRRCPTADHPRSNNGAYFWDGRRGWVQCWDRGEDIHWYQSEHRWTEEDKRLWVEQRRAHALKTARRVREAAANAQQMIAKARHDTHPYLEAKGFKDEPGLVIDKSLVIPMRTVISDEIIGAQLITWNESVSKWDKKMLPGMRARGAIYRIGPRSPKVSILCEGYVTGLSIAAATRLMRMSAAAIVCFSDRNMVIANPSIDGQKIVFADNDVSNAGENAAKDTGLRYCMSPTKGQDANDWHQEAGLFPLCKAIAEVMKQA